MNQQHKSHCKAMLNDLGAYIDGELDLVLCENLEAHIATCANCQVVLNTLEKTIHLIRRDGIEVKLPQEMRLRLFTCLGLDKDADGK